MPDDKVTGAEIEFDNGHKLQTPSTPEQIENEINGTTTKHIPLIPVELPNGETVKANAAQIRVIKSARSVEPEDIGHIEQM